MQMEACSPPFTASGLLCRMRCRRAHDIWTSCFWWGYSEFALVIFEQHVALGWVSFILGTLGKEALFVMSHYQTGVSSSSSDSISEAQNK